MNIGFMVLFPLVFAEQHLRRPGDDARLAQAFVDVNPISHLTTATRGLMHGNADGGDIAIVFAWAAGLTAVFAPLTVRLYRNRG